jgi:hypothetical protein
VSEACLIFRRAIEQKRKIECEVRLDFVDVVESGRVLNYYTSPPKPLRAVERPYSTKFSISQLTVLLKELQALSRDGLIESVALFVFCSRKLQLACDLPTQYKALGPT